MNMINVTLVGNLVKAPEQFRFPSGKIKTTMRIAVTNPSRNKEEGTDPNSDFYRIELWGKLAELASRYLLKGHQVGVSGRLIMEHWVDREGKERLTPVVAATQLQFPPRFGSTGTSQSRKSEEQENQFEPVVDEPEMDGCRPDMSHNELFENARVLSINETPRKYSPFKSSRRMA